jgi:predicted metal-dependent phosphoesterase TrpH
VLKVDLHLHSREDPLDNIPHDAFALIDRAGQLGFDALALTLHDRQLTDHRVFEYARSRGIILIPGIERTLRGRHILLINFPKAAEDVTSFEDIARLKASHNGLVVAPHPFFPDPKCLRGMMDERPDLFDAVEWSYFWTKGLNYNTRARLWARTHGTTVIGNSDTHDLRQLGRTFSWVDSDRHPDAICDAVRNGKVILRTDPVPLQELARVAGAMVARGLLPKARRESALDRTSPVEL